MNIQNIRERLEAMQMSLNIYNVSLHDAHDPFKKLSVDIFAKDLLDAKQKAIAKAKSESPKYEWVVVGYKILNNKKEAMPTLDKLNLFSDWGSCKMNSDKIQKSIGGQSKQIAIATEVDGINGHYYWTDGNYVVDKVIKSQPQVYSMLKSKEIKPGVWKYRDYVNTLGIQD